MKDSRVPTKFQAPCGDTLIYPVKPGRKTLGSLVVGWEGHPLHDTMKQPKYPPPKCIGCPKLKQETRTYYTNPNESFKVNVWACHGYRAVAPAPAAAQ